MTNICMYVYIYIFIYLFIYLPIVFTYLFLQVLTKKKTSFGFKDEGVGTDVNSVGH